MLLCFKRLSRMALYLAVGMSASFAVASASSVHVLIFSPSETSAPPELVPGKSLTPWENTPPNLLIDKKPRPKASPEDEPTAVDASSRSVIREKASP